MHIHVHSLSHTHTYRILTNKLTKQVGEKQKRQEKEGIYKKITKISKTRVVMHPSNPDSRQRQEHPRCKWNLDYTVRLYIKT